MPSSQRHPETFDSGMHVVTLGVAAGPAIRSASPGIATAVVVDGEFYLVDFGLGVTRAAHAAGLRGRRWRAGFVTHLHSDHVVEIPGFLLWNWGKPVDGFETPIPILGPTGTHDMVRSVLDAYRYDIGIRISDEARPDLAALVQARDIPLPPAVTAQADGHTTPAMEPFEIYRDELITVTAILVAHPPVFPAFAFRIESKYGSVAFSGDTAECANMVTLATGADLLVHEAVNLDFYRRHDFAPEFLNHQEQSHTTPAGVGRVAAAAGVPHVVLSHLAGVATDEEWSCDVRREFAGEVTVAHPGDVFAVNSNLAVPSPA